MGGGGGGGGVIQRNMGSMRYHTKSGVAMVPRVVRYYSRKDRVTWEVTLVQKQ